MSTWELRISKGRDTGQGLMEEVGVRFWFDAMLLNATGLGASSWSESIAISAPSVLSFFLFFVLDPPHRKLPTITCNNNPFNQQLKEIGGRGGNKVLQMLPNFSWHCWIFYVYLIFEEQMVIMISKYITAVIRIVTWTGVAAISNPPTPPPMTRPSGLARDTLSPPVRLREPPSSVSK